MVDKYVFSYFDELTKIKLKRVRDRLMSLVRQHKLLKGTPTLAIMSPFLAQESAQCHLVKTRMPPVPGFTTFGYLFFYNHVSRSGFNPERMI